MTYLLDAHARLFGSGLHRNVVSAVLRSQRVHVSVMCSFIYQSVNVYVSLETSHI